LTVEEPSIGERIRALRGGVMTQHELAATADVSVDLVRKLEQGRRHTASITSLHKIAKALDVDTAELLARATPLASADLDCGVVAMRHALTSIDGLLGEVEEDGEKVSVLESKRTVAYAWGCYWTGRYEMLAGLLPSLLAQVRAARRAAICAERAAAAELSAELHQVAACTLVHLGYADPAFLALRDGLAAAEEGDDELRPATLRCSLSWLLLTQGRYAEASNLAQRTAIAMEPQGDVPPAHLSVWGSLLVTAATATARDGAVLAARNLLQVAGEVADRIGHDRTDYQSPFGPSQVVMQTVDVHVVTEEHTSALDAARRMAPDAALPTAARARHLADVAYAHARLGHDSEALGTLLTMERTAPAWTRYQSLPRQVVRELMRRERGGRATKLRELACRLGVTA
jgi:transcriptional regulator with XRE-family HTH domain